MRNVAKFLSAGVFAAAAVAGLVAQAPAPAAPQGRQEGVVAPTQPNQQPTFRVAVDLVTTDVIVRDDHGRFVSDLTRDNFTVLEDDQAQQIESFMLVRGGRTFNLLAPQTPAAPDGLVLPQVKPKVDDTAGRVLLVIIDDLHFEADLSPHVRKVVQTDRKSTRLNSSHT